MGGPRVEVGEMGGDGELRVKLEKAESMVGGVINIMGIINILCV